MRSKSSIWCIVKKNEQTGELRNKQMPQGPWTISLMDDRRMLSVVNLYNSWLDLMTPFRMWACPCERCGFHQSEHTRLIGSKIGRIGFEFLRLEVMKGHPMDKTKVN